MNVKYDQYKMYQLGGISQSGAYIAISDMGTQHPVSYDSVTGTMYSAINETFTIIGYIAVAELPELTFGNAKPHSLYRISEARWLTTTAVYKRTDFPTRTYVYAVDSVTPWPSNGYRWEERSICLFSRREKPVSVAIDGPAGAGKTTMAMHLASRLGFRYVDTGAMYRAVALAASRVPGESIETVLSSLDMSIDHDCYGEQHMFLGSEEVTSQIRSEQVSMMASATSALSCVRKYLLGVQRDLAACTSVIMEGRDIGTVILPDADVKMYLTADLEVRARRRTMQLLEAGKKAIEVDVLSEMSQRDHNDSTRAAAPLKMADGATLVDSTSLSENDTFVHMLGIIREALEKTGE